MQQFIYVKVFEHGFILKYSKGLTAVFMNRRVKIIKVFKDFNVFKK